MPPLDSITVKSVPTDSKAEIQTIRELFLEYAKSLNFDLCFQGFDKEVAGLPGGYAPPDGRLMLALCDRKVAGCVGLQKVTDGVCEMKRLWVRPEFRGRKIGRKLADAIIAESRQIGYTLIKLDTIDTMVEAISMYKSMGFSETSAYRYNPIEGAKYMELKL
ncbi:MAG: GNAT family N-acetyltransferase [Candidatus Zixiibacteriota bacterium]